MTMIITFKAIEPITTIESTSYAKQNDKSWKNCVKQKHDEQMRQRKIAKEKQRTISLMDFPTHILNIMAIYMLLSFFANGLMPCLT